MHGEETQHWLRQRAVLAAQEMLSAHIRLYMYCRVAQYPWSVDSRGWRVSAANLRLTHTAQSDRLRPNPDRVWRGHLALTDDEVYDGEYLRCAPDTVPAAQWAWLYLHGYE